MPEIQSDDFLLNSDVIHYSVLDMVLEMEIDTVLDTNLDTVLDTDLDTNLNIVLDTDLDTNHI